MKWISFSDESGVSFGVVVGDQVADMGADYPDLKSAIGAGLPSTAPASAPRIPLADVTLLPVIPNPAKIFCIGLNYVDHREETGRPVVAHPTVFTRFADTQVAHGQPLIVPAASVQLDFEGELAVIIGRGGRRIAESEAMDHVAGYACYHDASVRDWQMHTSQYTPGKNFPGTGGFGPWMVTADEIPDPSVMELTTRLNGEVVQHASLADLIFPIPRLIAYLSAFCELSPGDVISTGTPGGVGAKRTPPLWMKPGDLVEVHINGVGVLRNPVAAE